MLCAFILYMSGGMTDRLEFFFYWEKVAEEIISYFNFDVCSLNSGFTFNKPTHQHLIYYGDFIEQAAYVACVNFIYLSNFTW